MEERRVLDQRDRELGVEFVDLDRTLGRLGGDVGGQAGGDDGVGLEEALVLAMLEARGVRILRVPSATELGQAVGREQTAAVGIVDRELARGIRALTDSAPERARKEELA